MGRFVVEFMRIEEPSVHATTILFRLNGWRKRTMMEELVAFVLYVCMMMSVFFWSKSSILEIKTRDKQR